jgi:hypothetical protein
VGRKGQIQLECFSFTLLFFQEDVMPIDRGQVFRDLLCSLWRLGQP